MTLNFTVTALNATRLQSGPAVVVQLAVSADGQPMGAPQPQPIAVYLSQQDGDELELGETFSVDVKPDKP